MNNDFIDILKYESKNHGIDLSDDVVRLLDDFRRELIEGNKKVNLTRIIDNEDFAIKHVIDSLMVINKLDIKKGNSLIDIGTGPGIPGIILKIVRPDLKVALLESQRKKTDFLEYAIETLGLQQIRIINDRAEEAAREGQYREQFDVAIARAVSSLNVLSELTLPFVKIGGSFIAMKGEAFADEIEESRKAIKILGGRIESLTKYILGQDMARSLFLVSKVMPCPKKYPRRPGMPAKKPL